MRSQWEILYWIIPAVYCSLGLLQTTLLNLEKIYYIFHGICPLSIGSLSQDEPPIEDTKSMNAPKYLIQVSYLEIQHRSQMNYYESHQVAWVDVIFITVRLEMWIFVEIPLALCRFL